MYHLCFKHTPSLLWKRIHYIDIPDLTQCQHPATPANGRVTLSGTGIGSSAVYACNPGFELTGTVTAICTAPADRETGMATFQPSTLRTCQCMCTGACK